MKKLTLLFTLVILLTMLIPITALAQEPLGCEYVRKKSTIGAARLPARTRPGLNVPKRAKLTI